jgi:hypothetical protein
LTEKVWLKRKALFLTKRAIETEVILSMIFFLKQSESAQKTVQLSVKTKIPCNWILKVREYTQFSHIYLRQSLKPPIKFQTICLGMKKKSFVP